MTAEPTLPAAKVAEVLQLIDRFLSQEVAAPRAERYQTLEDESARRPRLRAGKPGGAAAGHARRLLSNRAGGVTAHLRWLPETRSWLALLMEVRSGGWVAASWRVWRNDQGAGRRGGDKTARRSVLIRIG
jgi:hypothetical protein